MGDVFILSRAVLAMLRADTCLPFTSTIHYGKKRGPKTSGEAEEGDLVNYPALTGGAFKDPKTISTVCSARDDDIEYIYGSLPR